MSKLDPRTKIVIVLCLFALIFTGADVIFQFILSCMLFVLTILSHFSLKRILGPVRFLIYFLPLTFLIHFFFTIHGYNLIAEGKFGLMSLSIPLKFTLRLWNIIFLTSIALRLFKGADLIDGVNLFSSNLRKRFRSLDNFIQILNIALRFFPLIREEYEQVAVSERIFRLSTPRTLKHRIKRLKLFLPAVVVLSLKRAENLALAMELRGYGLVFPRTDYFYRKLPSGEIPIIICFLVLTGILLIFM